mmetsp:Transcript_27013/g.57840  ORF Transcript_27013/g.57840 Transcript_27013/m.57840 type:complete len:89 (-) Transcript_27013:702-968(-)
MMQQRYLFLGKGNRRPIYPPVQWNQMMVRMMLLFVTPSTAEDDFCHSNSMYSLQIGSIPLAVAVRGKTYFLDDMARVLTSCAAKCNQH